LAGGAELPCFPCRAFPTKKSLETRPFFVQSLRLIYRSLSDWPTYWCERYVRIFIPSTGVFYETAIFCCGPMRHKKAAPAEMRGAASPQGEQWRQHPRGGYKTHKHQHHCKSYWHKSIKNVLFGQGYEILGLLMSDEAIFIGGGGANYATAQQLLLKYANRHGLIAGATGTGKTVTL
jgi:hypothetical protein